MGRELGGKQLMGYDGPWEGNLGGSIADSDVISKGLLDKAYEETLEPMLPGRGILCLPGVGLP